MRAAGEPMGVEVTKQKRTLEEDEACEPNRGRTSEDGQELFCCKRLNYKEQKGGEEGSSSVEKAV